MKNKIDEKTSWIHKYENIFKQYKNSKLEYNYNCLKLILILISDIMKWAPGGTDKELKLPQHHYIWQRSRYKFSGYYDTCNTQLSILEFHYIFQEHHIHTL